MVEIRDTFIESMNQYMRMDRSGIMPINLTERKQKNALDKLIRLITGIFMIRKNS